MVYFSFFFIFKFHRATHGKRARTKSRTADHARYMLGTLEGYVAYGRRQVKHTAHNCGHDREIQ